MHVTIEFLQMASLAAGPGAGPLPSWPRAIQWVGIGALIGTPLLLLGAWVALRLERLRRQGKRDARRDATWMPWADLLAKSARRTPESARDLREIAHELNNTLTAILGFTELAFPAVPAASRARRHLKQIMKAGARAKDLIHQILTFSRQTEHALSPVRLQEVLLPRGSERVLLVEDEPAAAELGRHMLRSLGYEVVVRTSPTEALRAFTLMPQRFDLLITDQTMPRMTGETLVQEALRMRPDLPVIMMTGFSHTRSADKAGELGGCVLLHKPLRLRDLAPAIQRALGKAGAPRPQGEPHGQLDHLLEFTRNKQVHAHDAVGPDRR